MSEVSIAFHNLSSKQDTRLGIENLWIPGSGLSRFEDPRDSGASLWKIGVDSPYPTTCQLSAAAITLDNALQYLSTLITLEFLQPAQLDNHPNQPPIKVQLLLR